MVPLCRKKVEPKVVKVENNASQTVRRPGKPGPRFFRRKQKKRLESLQPFVNWIVLTKLVTALLVVLEQAAFSDLFENSLVLVEQATFHLQLFSKTKTRQKQKVVVQII